MYVTPLLHNSLDTCNSLHIYNSLYPRVHIYASLYYVQARQVAAAKAAAEADPRLIAAVSREEDEAEFRAKEARRCAGPAILCG